MHPDPIPRADRYALRADTAELMSNWLFVSDGADAKRWYVRLSDIVTWHYSLDLGAVTIWTATGIVLVVTAVTVGDDAYRVTNELDQLLYEALAADRSGADTPPPA